MSEQPPKLAVQFEGFLDTLFLSFYSIGLFVSGRLGDSVDPKKLLVAVGHTGTSLTFILFGLSFFFGKSIIERLLMLCRDTSLARRRGGD